MTKTIVDPEKCIGCGACVSVCGDAFEMKDIDFKGEKKHVSVPIEGGEDAPCVDTAIDTCPVDAISKE